MLFTFTWSTAILGLAEWYNIYKTFMPMAIAIPTLKGITKQAMKANRPTKTSDPKRYILQFNFFKDIKYLYLLLLCHMGTITWYCNWNSTAAIIMAAKVALGI